MKPIITNILEYLKTINKCQYAQMLKRHHLDWYQFIMDETSFLPINSIMNERIYCLEHDIHSRQLCKECNKNPVSFDTTGYRYRQFCSAKCGTLNKDTQQKRKESCIEKYGVEHPLKSNIVKEKIQQTNLEKYGVKYTFQDKHVQQKRKATCIEKYGVEYPAQANEIKEKTKKTCKERYGVDYSFQSEEVKEKSKNTCIEKYGVEKIGQAKEIKDKIHKTNLERYGVKMPLQSKEIFEKTMAKEKHNTFINNILNNSFVKPLFSEEEWLKNKDDGMLKWQCKKCGNVFDAIYNGNLFAKVGPAARCENCYPIHCGISNTEKEIYEFILKIFNGEIIHNDRTMIKPYELDIYIPDKKLAFEFDGLFWHSELHETPKNYHVDKTNKCEKQDIHLIHIFENEWLYKQDIVKSRIKNLLGLHDYKCYARQCEVKEILSKDSIEFQNNNHIQGACKSKINIGLFYNNELVSLMTFSKPRFNKKYEYELVRFCNKLGWHIPGGASKLLSYFEKTYKPKSLISYADRRWSNGNVYQKLGFTLDHISSPDYWYFKKKTLSLESRVKYQKYKLKNLLEIFDSSKTEVENMHNNGYNRIFDCGNLVFVKKYSK